MKRIEKLGNCTCSETVRFKVDELVAAVNKLNWWHEEETLPKHPPKEPECEHEWELRPDGIVCKKCNTQGVSIPTWKWLEMNKEKPTKKEYEK